MFYDLLDLQLNNNNYRLLQVNKSVKNKFLTNFLIGLDSKYLKLDEPDMNKTSNYYKDKLNDKIMLQYNKNFSKANTSHLDYLSDICRVNLVIYDMAKNKQKYANNNGSNKTLYMLKSGTSEYLLLKDLQIDLQENDVLRVKNSGTSSTITYVVTMELKPSLATQFHSQEIDMYGNYKKPKPVKKKKTKPKKKK